jgi:hypothetical protein
LQISGNLQPQRQSAAAGASGVREGFANPLGLPCRLELRLRGLQVTLMNRRDAVAGVQVMRETLRRDRARRAAKRAARRKGGAGVGAGVGAGAGGRSGNSSADDSDDVGGGSGDDDVDGDVDGDDDEEDDEADDGPTHAFPPGDDVPDAEGLGLPAPTPDASEIPLLAEILPARLRPAFYRLCPVTQLEVEGGAVAIGSLCLPVTMTVSFSRARVLHLLTPPPPHLAALDLHRSWTLLRTLDARVTMSRNEAFKGQEANAAAADTLRAETIGEEIRASAQSGLNELATGESWSGEARRASASAAPLRKLPCARSRTARPHATPNRACLLSTTHATRTTRPDRSRG